MPSKKSTKTSSDKIKKLSPTNKLKNQIKILKNTIDENSEKHLRLKAEFDNYRKRKDKEIQHLLKYEGESVIKNFLSVLDDLERLNEASANKDNDNIEIVKISNNNIQTHIITNFRNELTQIKLTLKLNKQILC